MASADLDTIYGATPITSPAAGDLIYVDRSAADKAITALDLLGLLLSAADIAVTGAVTATIGRMHYCTGTSADYTITLPAASGNAGKMIGFQMGPIASLSKLITLDGNSSETIDGATTRIMWALESCILRCDGSNWFKLSGKSIPMMGRMYLNSASQSVNNNSQTKITLDGTDIDNTGLMCDAATNHLITIKRAGYYSLQGRINLGPLVTSVGSLIDTVLNKNAGTLVDFSFGVGAVGQYTSLPAVRASVLLAAADTIQLDLYQNTGVAQTVNGGNANETELVVTELPTW